MAQDQRRAGQSIPTIRRPISEESWIEVSSRPSSSSLSSAATDEVVTTGLRVSQEAFQRRRRRLIRSETSQVQGRIPLDISQEEYEGSEADSDKVLSSSNEDLQPRFLDEHGIDGSPPMTIPTAMSSDGDSIQDDLDEIATALGPAHDSPIFTPQPNVFSHPPSARLTRQDEDSYFPQLPSSHTSSARPSTSTSSVPSTLRPSQRQRAHNPYNMIAPSASVDHDAALRASLSTLLSCAAAARGLQKREPATSTGSSRSIHPPRTRGAGRPIQGTLRMVPESALDQIEEHTRHSTPPTSDTPGSPSSLPSKRKSKSPVRDKQKRNRSAYNLQHEDIMNISPTLTTWVVGAGVLVLFSAISFTAGYTLGKEVGRVDAMSNGPLGCGTEVDGSGIGRGLARRSAWRWGNASGIKA